MSEDKQGLIEALLFTATKPLQIKELQSVTDLSKSQLKDIIADLIDEYQSPDRGLELLQVNQGYQLQTKPDYQEQIEKLHQPEVSNSLTQASLETLTIVAYKQPVTRTEIEEVRGVNVSKSLKTLQQRGLVEELGTKETIGNPIIYGTSEEFLEYFGLDDLDDLPQPKNFSNLSEEELLEDKEATVN
ncbi:MAG: SMC-Scp complex subunit ScpB [Bacillota bacterium]